jgi:hypothetical protein
MPRRSFTSRASSVSCGAPGPEVARQTPTSPVNFACAQAMNAAISS